MSIWGSMRLPGGPKQKSFRALREQPELALTHLASLPHPDFSSTSNNGDKNGNENNQDGVNGKDASDNVVKAPKRRKPIARRAFPHIIFEIGYNESYSDLLNDIADYLISSRGKIKLAILLHMEHPHPVDQQQHQLFLSSLPSCASLQQAISMQLSTPYSTVEEYSLWWEAASERAVADACVPGLTAFVEAWEYTATATASAGNSDAPALRHIALRAPGRSYLMRDGLPQEEAGIMMCRADFGLPAVANAGAGEMAPETAMRSSCCSTYHLQASTSSW